MNFYAVNRGAKAVTHVTQADLALRPLAGSDINFAISRAQSMNSSANGLSVRFLTVIMPTALRCDGNLIGSIFSPTRLALSFPTELGNSPM